MKNKILNRIIFFIHEREVQLVWLAVALGLGGFWLGVFSLLYVLFFVYGAERFVLLKILLEIVPCIGWVSGFALAAYILYLISCDLCHGVIDKARLCRKSGHHE